MTSKTIQSDLTYTDTTFKKLDLLNDTVSEATFSDCKFIRCNFSETAFEACRFIDCVFDECSMKRTGVRDSSFARVKFQKCNLLGVDWTDARWSPAKTNPLPVTFEGCDLKYAAFFGLDLKKLSMTHCTAHEANFGEAILTDADFTGTDFTNAVFLRTDVSGANFVGATRYTLSVHLNKTKGAKFSLPEALRLLYSMDLVMIDPNTQNEVSSDDLPDALL